MPIATTIIWATLADRDHWRLTDAVRAKILAMLDEGKVAYGGHSVRRSPVETVRFWNSQQDADEFITWLRPLAEEFNLNLVSVECESKRYSDYAPMSELPAPYCDEI